MGPQLGGQTYSLFPSLYGKSGQGTGSYGPRGLSMSQGSHPAFLLLLLVTTAACVTLEGGAVPRVEAATCGNGTIESGEACDDGNVISSDGCSATCTIEQECYDAGNRFSFFVWSDSYPGSGNGGVRFVFEDAVDEEKYPTRIIPRFWFSTGDIPFMTEGTATLDTLNSTISDVLYPFFCSASNRKFPYFVAIGNHDVDGYNGIAPHVQYDYWSNYVGSRVSNTLVGLKNFREGPRSSDGHDARTTYSFDYKNTHFVVVNQYYQDPSYPFYILNGPLGCMRQELYDWVDADLAQTTQPLKFVFGHEPTWSFCSNLSGFGAPGCTLQNPDNQNPPYRQRPYSPLGQWLQPFGRHWGDSLEDNRCPDITVAGVGRRSREAFWEMLANHSVIAHFNGHTHTYSSRLVQGDGVRRNDISAFAKTGQQFSPAEGVWEVDSGQTHNSAGTSYILTTVTDNVATFETFDQLGNEDFLPVESWSVAVGPPPPPNSAPELTVIAPQVGNEQTLLNFTATATDVDSGQTLTYSLINNPPSGASINATSGLFSWTPTEAQGPGPHSVTIKVTDNGRPALSAQQVVNITINEVNLAPALAAIGSQSATVTVPLTFTASATDPDQPANTLTYSLVDAPSGAEINASTGVFTWTPTAVGPVNFSVVVTDNGDPVLSATQPVTVNVADVNHAPELALIPAQVVDEQALLSFSATATENDSGQTVTFSLENAPSGASIDATTGLFSWTPTEIQGPGPYTVTVKVTDSGTPVLSAQQLVSITVNEVNQAPTLNAISNKSVTIPNTLNFTAVATDPDHPANTLTYSLENAPSGATINPTTGLFSWAPATAGTYTLTVVVTDNGNPALSASRPVTITVSPSPTTNTAPVLAFIPPQTVTEQTQLSFTATATDANSGQTLTYSLINSPPSGTSINANTGVFSWTPAEARGPGVYTVTVRVRDNGSPVLSAQQDVTITVTEVNRTPTLGAISNKTVTRPNSLTFTAVGTDPDVPANSLSYSLVNAPAGASMNATTGVFNWTPTVAGSFTFTVRVTDNGTPALSAQRSVKVTVK